MGLLRTCVKSVKDLYIFQQLDVVSCIIVQQHRPMFFRKRDNTEIADSKSDEWFYPTIISVFGESRRALNEYNI